MDLTRMAFNQAWQLTALVVVVRLTPRWCWAVMLLLAAGSLPGATLVLATDESVPPESKAEPLQVVADGVASDTQEPKIELEVEILRASQETVDAAVSGWIMPATSDPPQADADRALPVQPKSVRLVEARLPLVYKVIDDEESAAITRSLGEDRRASQLAAPRVVLHDGQTTSIKDTVQRPFVVGLLRDGQPRIRVISEGVTLQLHLALLDEMGLQLEYDLRVSRITDVQTSTFKLEGREAPLAMQVPVVAITDVAAKVEFQLGKTLLIGGVTTEDDAGKPQAMLVLVKAIQRPTVVRGEGLEPTFAICYAVADLLQEDLHWLNQPEVAAGEYNSAKQRAAEILIASIRERIEPGSWNEAGGRRGIEAFLTNQSLVVLQTESGHRKVHAYLHDIRVGAGLAAKTEQAPPLVLPRGKTRQADTNVYPKVYNVADLVIPIPSAVRGPKDLPRYGKIPDGAIADYDTLIDLITSTISPDSWQEVGGTGGIEPFPTNLSLVVSQTRDIHDQIADLLEQLRRLQDVQITIETHWLKVPKSFLPPDELPGFVVRDFTELDARGVDDAGGPSRLSATRTLALLQAVRGSDYRIFAGPKITLFNGQQAEMSFNENGLVKSTQQYQATSSVDHQSVFLKVATDADTQLDEIVAETILSGGSLLFRIDESMAPTWDPEPANVNGSTYSQYISYVTRLFEKTPAPTEHVQLLLITPKVIVGGE